MCYSTSPKKQRQAVLIVAHPDNHIEVFAENNVDIHFARIPMSFSTEGEYQAEEVMEAMLPPRYSDIYRADRLRKTGTSRPLRPSVLQDSLSTRVLLKVLDRVPGILRTADAIPDAVPVVDHDAALQRARRLAT